MTYNLDNKNQQTLKSVNLNNPKEDKMKINFSNEFMSPEAASTPLIEKLLKMLQVFDKLACRTDKAKLFIEPNTIYYNLNYTDTLPPIRVDDNSNVLIDIEASVYGLYSATENYSFWKEVSKIAEVNSDPSAFLIKRIKVVSKDGDINTIAIYIEELNVLLLKNYWDLDDLFKENGSLLTEFKKLMRRATKTKYLKPTPEVVNYDITIGADPEFEITNSDKEIIRASKVRINNKLRRNVGIDGSGKQIEFRPDPADDPIKAADNFERIVKSFETNYKKNSLITRGDIHPLGGHIHFGSKERKLPKREEFITLLDNWLGKRLINLSGKARADYKKLGSSRPQPHGFEYRSLPAAVFYNREILKAVYKISYTLAAFYYNGISVVLNPDKEDYIELDLLDEFNAIEKFVSEWKEVNSDIFVGWNLRKTYKEKIKEEETYHEYGGYDECIEQINPHPAFLRRIMRQQQVEVTRTNRTYTLRFPRFGRVKIVSERGEGLVTIYSRRHIVGRYLSIGEVPEPLACWLMEKIFNPKYEV